MIPQRKKRNSSKVNLIISLVFHTCLVLGIGFLAAREGMLGKTLKQITVTMAPKEKKPEPPKEKEKPVAPKVEQAKAAEVAKPVVSAAPPPQVATAPPPVQEAAPTVAPAAAVLPDMVFDDGAKQVQVGDANSIYKGLIEHAIRARWERPEDIADEAFVAEVELSVGQSGELGAYRWLKGSGNGRWDDSVKAALTKTKAVTSKPPKGFPGKFVVRFDVESQRTESVLQLSAQ